MAISVRRARHEDLPILRRHQARPELGLADLHFAQQESGRLHLGVAFHDSAPVGTAVLDLEAGGMTPELRNMYVYPHARRLGAGRALTEFLEALARQAGFPAVYLAVDPNNERAIPLYISLEYYPTGEHLRVSDPEVQQVADRLDASRHYAVYMKSLSAR